MSKIFFKNFILSLTFFFYERETMLSLLICSPCPFCSTTTNVSISWDGAKPLPDVRYLIQAHQAWSQNPISWVIITVSQVLQQQKAEAGSRNRKSNSDTSNWFTDCQLPCKIQGPPENPSMCNQSTIKNSVTQTIQSHFFILYIPNLFCAE